MVCFSFFGGEIEASHHSAEPTARRGVHSEIDKLACQAKSVGIFAPRQISFFGPANVSATSYHALHHRSSPVWSFTRGSTYICQLLFTLKILYIKKLFMKKQHCPIYHLFHFLAHNLKLQQLQFIKPMRYFIYKPYPLVLQRRIPCRSSNKIIN